MGSLHVLMGNLSFPNEVGNTRFEIKDDKDTLLTVTFEVFRQNWIIRMIIELY